MSKNIKIFNSKSKEIIGIIIIILVGIGFIATILADKQSTEYQQHASSFQNLNSADQIIQTNNPDGTMGGVDYTHNFSSTLPEEFLGSLNFQITDPPQGIKTTDSENSYHGKPTDFPDNSHALTGSNTPVPTHTISSQTQDSKNDNGQDNGNRPTFTSGLGNNGNDKNHEDGIQAVTSLLITVTKVEVHLAHVGIPGSKNIINTAFPTLTRGKPTSTPKHFTNQDVDKWEVLNINVPQTFDLVQLAKAKSLSSLGITKLTNGRYTEIRLYISAASATVQSGAKVTLTIPGKANIVRVIKSFVINSGKTTTLTMDFDAQNSVVKAGNVYILKPVIAHLIEDNEQ